MTAAGIGGRAVELNSVEGDFRTAAWVTAHVPPPSSAVL